MVDEIRAAPAFILNNLVGPSSYEFIGPATTRRVPR